MKSCKVVGCCVEVVVLSILEKAYINFHSWQINLAKQD